jgi:hypothetical protein
MVAVPFRTTPSLGPELTQVIPAATGSAWYDMPVMTYATTAPMLASPQLGNTEMGSDGRLRMWVEASGTIADAAAPGTQIAITVTGYDDVTAATGAGGWYAPPTTVYGTDILAGDRFWATKGTAP